MSAEPQDWVAAVVEQTDRAERAEAERDRALTVAETAMRIMTHDQLIEMRHRLDKGEDHDQPEPAPERAGG